ncbi:MAG: alpha/beta fold hydrolase [Polyangiaceae bacterium]
MSSQVSEISLSSTSATSEPPPFAEPALPTTPSQPPPSAADAAKEARAKAREAEKELLVKSRAFATENKAKSWAYVFQTFSLLGVASLLAGAPLLNQVMPEHLAPLAWALRGVLSVIAGLLIVRAFILFHDHLHGALLARSKLAKVIFWVFGAVILSPVTVWRETHNYHHNNNAKIVGSHVGSYMMLTVEMWQDLKPSQKLAYHLTRHPITMLLGYLTIFMWGMCFSPLIRNFRKNLDSLLSLIIHAALVVVSIKFLGVAATMLGFIGPLMLACAAGAYLFYAQHNFPEMHVQPRQTWSYTRAALESSSFLETGPVMAWFTGNIGYHHVHHLNPAIPFYRLPEAMEAIQELQNPGRTSLWPRDVLACFKLKLWSAKEDRMVGYPPAVLASRLTMSETQPRWQRRLKRLAKGARNALEVMRVGRLGAPYQAPFDVVWQEAVYKLRHYTSPARDGVIRTEAPILLVPPLMVTSEIYDISPELSAVARLREEGVDVWLVDFGSPEVEEGGMDRTLDDHVRAVSDAIDRVCKATGKDVHLAGYSQGGMFAYQTAAYRQCKGIASLITFGSPVDIHRNLPAVDAAIAERVIRTARSVLSVPLQKTESLPGSLTSTGFKILSARKEIQQFADFVQKLHDRRALEQRERSRRFLAGEGFVAWPGPALRKFVDELIVNNRMTSGGFVIDGRTVTLADIRIPILYFVGETDDIARPASVRAIQRAAPDADLNEIAIRAGHFGLVVGSKALSLSWPTVVDWIRWKEGVGERPALLPSSEDGETSAPTPQDIEDAAFEDEDFDIELFYEVATSAVDSVWNRLGDASKDVADVVDYLRWQMPRLVRLQRMDDTSRVSFGRVLADQASAIPHETFFLWKGRAFTYQDADQRVSNVVRGLIACGIKPGDRVAILMEGRPSYLTMACALSRLGAVAILLGADERRVKVARAL